MDIQTNADLLGSYPYAPSPGQTDTSGDGAAAIAPVSAVLRDEVLRAVTAAGAAGITVLEMCERYRRDRMGVQPRFSELRQLGRIADSGIRRKNPSGVNAICWVLPDYLLEGQE